MEGVEGGEAGEAQTRIDSEQVASCTCVGCTYVGFGVLVAVSV